MKRYSKVLCVASRGRGDNNAQHFEARADGCTSTLTSVQKDNLILTICQKTIPNLTKGYSLMLGGYSNTITTFCSVDNQIMELKDKDNMNELVSHEHPTKEQLLEYFSRRIRVRKMTPKEAMRLMDVDDSDIDKIMNATETFTLKDGTVKTKKAISKTAVYKLAGNSIVVSVLYHIFRTMFIPNQPENNNQTVIQLSLFDGLE